MKSILILLEFVFARKAFYKINIILLKLIIRFIGYNNHSNFNNSGEIHFLKKICNENPKLCIDIGANAGNYSKYLLENSSSKILAFEPIPQSFKKLQKIKRNYLNRFLIYKLGIGEKNSKNVINYNQKNLQWANFNSEVNQINYLQKNNKKLICTLVTLDNFIKTNIKLFNNGIDLIKIDTEGYEYEVLIGAKNTIKKFKPKYIQIEYNWHHLFKNVNLYFFSKYLKNYDTYKILPFSKNLMKIDPKRPEHNYFNYSNIVFIRKK
jgi:FkbM family methyltransferase